MKVKQSIYEQCCFCSRLSRLCSPGHGGPVCSAADSSLLGNVCRLWPVQVALRGLGDTSSERASVTWPAVPRLSLGWEDPLEKVGSGNPLQYPCLENPMD